MADQGLLSVEAAHQAAQALAEAAELERTKIDLFSLFAKRGFSGKLIDVCIEKWGARAPQKIRRNAYVLMLNRLPSAGFKRCDKLWLDLGGRKGRLKRQALCLWHHLQSDSSGHTWFLGEKVAQAIEAQVGESLARPVQAIRLAIRCKWITRRKDEQGKVWLAEAGKAWNEFQVSEKIKDFSNEYRPLA